MTNLDAPSDGTLGGGEVEVDHDTETTTITLWGEIDMDTEARLELLRVSAVGTAYEVVLDTSAVTFLDSRAIVFIAKLVRTLAPRKVLVPDPPAVVMYLLHMTRIDTLLHITRSEICDPAVQAPPA